MSKTLIAGALLADPRFERGRRADVLIDGQHIAAILEGDQPRPQDAFVIDARNCALIPGLINGHMHAHANLAKGMGDLWTLEMSLAQAPGVIGQRSTEIIYASTLIGAAEMLLKGCTATYDMVMEFPAPTPQGFNAVAQAYADSGMRAVIAPMVADTPFVTAIPGLANELKAHGFDSAAASPCTTTLLATLKQLLHGWNWPADRIRMALGPTIPLLCSDAFMEGCLNLAREYGAGLHTHLSESKVQALVANKKYKASITRHLERLGLLGPWLTCAHALWLDRSDMQLLADSGATVVHNPGSNFRLGSGVADVYAMQSAGVTVGLGTDGATCADSLNMFEAMRLMTHASRIFGRRHTQWLSAAQALEAATVNSAKAIGFGDSIGQIRVGAKADLVVLNLTRPHYVPLNNLVAQIVYGEDSSGVRDVFVDGKAVVRNSELTTINYPLLIEQVNNAALELQERNKGMRTLTAGMAKVAASFCHGIIHSPLEYSRYLHSI